MKSVRILCVMVAVSLAATSPAWAQARTFSADLSGDHEVPVRVTDGGGVVFFAVNAALTKMKYRLIVDNISNVNAAHIHLGAVGVNGEVVVTLFSADPAGGPACGTIAEGEFDASDLSGSLAGQPLSALVALMRTGGTYVNVHTNDGLPGDNTGAGDFSSGEIRGQIGAGILRLLP